MLLADNLYLHMRKVTTSSGMSASCLGSTGETTPFLIALSLVCLDTAIKWLLAQEVLKI